MPAIQSTTLCRKRARRMHVWMTGVRTAGHCVPFTITGVAKRWAGLWAHNPHRHLAPTMARLCFSLSYHQRGWTVPQTARHVRAHPVTPGDPKGRWGMINLSPQGCGVSSLMTCHPWDYAHCRSVSLAPTTSVAPKAAGESHSPQPACCPTMPTTRRRLRP